MERFSIHKYLNRTDVAQYLIHIAIWIVLFASPLMFFNHGEELNMLRYLRLSFAPLAIFIVFYINYFFLTPKYYIKGNKKTYFIVNIIFITAMAIGLHFWMEYAHGFDVHSIYRPPHPNPNDHPQSIFFILRDTFNLFIAAAVATMLVLSERWHKSENILKESEKARTEAELRNLRNQINPHFLLNTLNNIYALTAFDAVKAQYAIQELSKMLRHILYDNQKANIDLKEEARFLTNYVNLMKIRLTDNIKVNMNIDIPDNKNYKIAPMIIISLIENAFKHGISPTLSSFININISANDEMIVCNIENSNFPKVDADKSGHGIGLKQVEKRLELSYHEKYEWTKGVSEDKTKYKSKIIIYDTKLCNN